MGRVGGFILKIKERRFYHESKRFVRSLLNSEDVSLYNPREGEGGVLEWEGEFKQIPQQYFELIIDTMYSAPRISKGYYTVINLKTNFTRR